MFLIDKKPLLLWKVKGEESLILPKATTVCVCVCTHMGVYLSVCPWVCKWTIRSLSLPSLTITSHLSRKQNTSS